MCCMEWLSEREAAIANAPGIILEGEVRIWLARLDVGRAVAERLTGLLSDDERARAARFHFATDAIGFVVRRATLRATLGTWLGLEPRAVRFHYGAHGKPELAADCNATGLSFNVSHSASLALYAATSHRRVGVDIERVLPISDWESIAERAFSPAERNALDRLPEAKRPHAFFEYWTSKEAYLKATGHGLSRSPTGFTVTVEPGESVRLERVGGDPDEAGRWTIRALDLEPGYAAAVAVEGRPSRLVRVRPVMDDAKARE